MSDNKPKCLVPGCQGTLVPAVRGFHKCEECGAKIKDSLIAGQITPPTPAASTKTEAAATKSPSASKAKAKDKPKAEAKPKAEKPAGVARSKAETVTTPDGVKLHGKTTEIDCIDCGAKRVIKVQDAFQVKRCVACQKKFAKERRNTRLKEKRATAGQASDAQQ